MMIRPATSADLPAILGIYNEVIATTTAVFSELPVTLENRQTWWQERRAAGYPLLVAVATTPAAEGSGEGGTVLGFASFGDFRSWPGYRHTVEHSVHVLETARGRGVGSALVNALFPHAAALGKHVMVAGVDAANLGSLRMHERLGFERVAHFKEVGRKFDRWLDLVFLQRYVD